MSKRLHTHTLSLSVVIISHTGNQTKIMWPTECSERKAGSGKVGESEYETPQALLVALPTSHWELLV